MVFLGIDIGGTGLKVGLVDQAGQLLHTSETPTRALEGVEAVLGRVEGLARSVLEHARSPVAACGVGSAGRINAEGGQVVYASGNLPGWSGLELGLELSRRLKMPAIVDNDVNAAAVAEGWKGAARGVADFVMVTLGTGVGGAVVVGGKLWRGARWGAGEVGHMTLYPHGHACNCGGQGCAEQYVSAKALTRRASAELRSGRPFHGIREVLTQAERGQGDYREAARSAVEGFATDLAILLANLQQAVDPQVIVIGGGIVKLGYWWARLAEAVGREGKVRSLRLRIRPAHFGPQAGIVGAARLAMLATHPADLPPRRPGRLERVEG